MNLKAKILFSLGLLLGFLVFGTVPLQAAHAPICAIGDRAEVKWKGSWYPAHVTNVSGNKCFIHYDGYNNSWDEWVGPGRIRITGGPPVAVNTGYGYQTGEAVMVLWHGSWWPAHVIQPGVKSWKIHYDNYGNNWDEWVGPSRIRKR